jgi:hypothetical protein
MSFNSYPKNTNSFDSIKAIDKEILKKYSSYSQLVSLDEVPTKYQILLYKKASNVLKRINLANNINPNEDKLLRSIFSKADEFDLDEYDFDDLSEKYELIFKKIEQNIFKLNYYGSISFVSWNYRLQLTDQSGFKEPLYSKEKGICIGGGLSYFNSYWGVSLEGCYAYMSATVGEDSTTIKYNQSNVPIDAFLTKSIIFWKPKEDISLGVGPLLIYHNGTYVSPTGGSIQDGNSFSYGLLVDANWSWNNYKLNLGLGDLKNYKSSVWQFGIGYTF